MVAQQAAVQRKAVQGGEGLDLPLDAGVLLDREQAAKLLFVVQVLHKGSGEGLQLFQTVLAAALVHRGPQPLFQQLQRTGQRCAPAGPAHKGGHLLPGFQQHAVVVKVGVGNHPPHIVGNVPVQNPHKGLGEEEIHRLMQQRILRLGDQLLQKLIARQNRLLAAGIDLGKERLKGQALDIFLPQRWQDVGDVAAEQVVRRDDDDVVGVELLGGALIQ